MVVRYSGTDNADERDDPAEDMPESSNAQPFWSTIIWFIIALVCVVVLGLVVKTQGVGW